MDFIETSKTVLGTPYTQSTALGTAGVGDVGVCNYFPVSLLDSTG